MLKNQSISHHHYGNFFFILGSSPFKSNIHHNTTWIQNGFTIAGGNGKGNELNQLNEPYGMYIDDDQDIYVADYKNDRIVEWKCGATNGQVVAGGKGKGNQTNQLNGPTDVIVDNERNNLIICDSGNRRVVRWPRKNGTNGETIISNIDCRRLTMDNNGDLYISDKGKHEVRRWRVNDTCGTLVAGGNGKEIVSINLIFLPSSSSTRMIQFMCQIGAIIV